MKNYGELGHPRTKTDLESQGRKMVVYTDVTPIQNVEYGTLELQTYSASEIMVKLGDKVATISKVSLAACFQELNKDCAKLSQDTIEDGGFAKITMLEKQLQKAHTKIEELSHEIMKLKEGEKDE